MERGCTLRLRMLPQVLINAGQANAATGDAGYQDCLKSAQAVAEALSISADEVLLLSTGVIGRRIKMDALIDSVPKLASSLGDSGEDAHHAAVAITTTDLVSKSAALEVRPCHKLYGTHLALCSRSVKAGAKGQKALFERL